MAQVNNKNSLVIGCMVFVISLAGLGLFLNREKDTQLIFWRYADGITNYACLIKIGTNQPVSLAPRSAVTNFCKSGSIEWKTYAAELSATNLADSSPRLCEQRRFEIQKNDKAKFVVLPTPDALHGNRLEWSSGRMREFDWSRRYNP